MNGADYLILAVLLLSVLLGMIRGFVREAIALLGWLGGLWLAWRYAPLLEPYLGGMIGQPPVSTWVARGLIVMAALIAGWLLAGVLTYFLQHSGLSLMVDRLLGMFFGVVRGAVVVAVFVLLGQFVELNKVEWWRKSQLLPYAAELAGWIQTFAETGARELEKQSTRQADVQRPVDGALNPSSVGA
jgi:membrane protein required for colicin V production